MRITSHRMLEISDLNGDYDDQRQWWCEQRRRQRQRRPMITTTTMTNGSNDDDRIRRRRQKQQQRPRQSHRPIRKQQKNDSCLWMRLLTERQNCNVSTEKNCVANGKLDGKKRSMDERESEKCRTTESNTTEKASLCCALSLPLSMKPLSESHTSEHTRTSIHDHHQRRIIWLCTGSALAMRAYFKCATSSIFWWVSELVALVCATVNEMRFGRTEIRRRWWRVFVCCASLCWCVVRPLVSLSK